MVSIVSIRASRNVSRASKERSFKGSDVYARPQELMVDESGFSWYPAACFSAFVRVAGLRLASTAAILLQVFACASLAPP